MRAVSDAPGFRKIAANLFAKNHPSHACDAGDPEYDAEMGLLFCYESLCYEKRAACGVRGLEHDPEKHALGLDPMGGNRFSDKIMLKSEIQTKIRFNASGSWSSVPL
jgi:hypothetical protein